MEVSAYLTQEIHEPSLALLERVLCVCVCACKDSHTNGNDQNTRWSCTISILVIKV